MRVFRSARASRDTGTVVEARPWWYDWVPLVRCTECSKIYPRLVPSKEVPPCPFCEGEGELLLPPKPPEEPSGWQPGQYFEEVFG